jgi:hypothetical protein
MAAPIARALACARWAIQEPRSGPEWAGVVLAIPADSAGLDIDVAGDRERCRQAPPYAEYTSGRGD